MLLFMHCEYNAIFTLQFYVVELGDYISGMCRRRLTPTSPLVYMYSTQYKSEQLSVARCLHEHLICEFLDFVSVCAYCLRYASLNCVAALGATARITQESKQQTCAQTWDAARCDSYLRSSPRRPRCCARRRRATASCTMRECCSSQMAGAPTSCPRCRSPTRRSSRTSTRLLCACITTDTNAPTPTT